MSMSKVLAPATERAKIARELCVLDVWSHMHTCHKTVGTLPRGKDRMPE